MPFFLSVKSKTDFFLNDATEMQQEVGHCSVIENVINCLPQRGDLPGGQLSVFLFQLMLASLISNATPIKELILL